LKRNGILKTDVAVLGGGPAGSAAALRLTAMGYSTVVVERSDYRGVRVGETLPPAIRRLLVDLGIWDRFVAQGHSPAYGIRSVWGRDEVYENDFIFGPYGAGWHVDRVRFDSMLASCAESAGATVYRDARVSSCRIDGSRYCEIDIVSGSRSHSLRSKFTIDATGRTSWLARKQGARRITLDRLIGVLGFLAPIPGKKAPDDTTLIEAVENGWWYSAVLPDSSLIAAYMTDADIYAKGRGHSDDYWRQQLKKAKYTLARARHYAPAADLMVVPANTSRLDRAGTGNWLATGDSVMALDPLSGQGVYKAMESGLRAAHAVHDHLTGKLPALQEYGAAVEQDFKKYLRARSTFYGTEKRWPHEIFWQRRVSKEI
jgi:flavin-dependent dehydrogenase